MLRELGRDSKMLGLLALSAVLGCYEFHVVDFGARADASRDCCASDTDARPDARPDAPRMDATRPDASPDAEPGVRLPPPRPTGPDGPSLMERVYALRDVVLDQGGGRWAEIGWDLDGQITDDVSDEFLCTPPTEPLPPFDGPGGVDNTFGETVLTEVGLVSSGLEENARRRMAEGEAIVVFLRNWNGEDDDPSVELVVARAAGVTRADGLTLPQWDGEDRWLASAVDFSGAGIDRPLVVDDNAYVAGRRLVARLPDRQSVAFPWVADALLEARLTGTLLTGFISDDGLRLDQVWLAGRFGNLELAQMLESSGLCAGGIVRGLVDGSIQRGLDVRSTPGTGGPGVSCDAMSMAIEFTGFSALFEGLTPPSPPTPISCFP